MTTEELNQLAANVQYLLDRTAIQDKISLYALGQDHHQPGAENKNVLEEWGQIFAESAQINCTDVGLPIYSLQQYAELMRGPGLKGGGLEIPFKVWAHLEHQVKVEIHGDTANSISLHIHTHETKDGNGNTFAVGYWHDQWIRTDNGWLITNRRLQQLYFNTFALTENPKLLDIEL